MTTGVRERARQALRTEIAEAMSDLFAARGFSAVTVEEAAREVGISRATFFRYFGSKEDAVLAALEGSAIDFGAVLADLAPVAGENVWELLRRTFQTAVIPVYEGSARKRSRIRMINTTPSLRARLADRRYAREESLTNALADRIADPEAARPTVVAGLAGLDLALRRWAEGEESSLSGAIDEIFRHLVAADSVLPG